MSTGMSYWLFLKKRQNLNCSLLQIIGGALRVKFNLKPPAVMQLCRKQISNLWLWLSGRVHHSRLGGCRFKPHQKPYLVFLSMALYSLLSNGSNRENSSRYDRNIVSEESKQTNKPKKKHIIFYIFMNGDLSNFVHFTCTD